MASGMDVVNEARTWVGTRFHHQARLKGHGVDCIGLVVGVARALGLKVEDRVDYARFPDGTALAAELDRQFVAVPLESMQPGDILLFVIPKLPRHVGIYLGDGRMVHATSLVDRCIEVGIDAFWRRALVGAYRFPEVG